MHATGLHSKKIIVAGIDVPHYMLTDFIVDSIRGGRQQAAVSDRFAQVDILAEIFVHNSAARRFPLL